MQKEQHLLSKRENNFLSALALVRRIAAFKLRGAHRDAAEDIVQKVSLNLWRWNVRRNELATEDAADEFSSIMNEEVNPDAEGAASKELTGTIENGEIRENIIPLSPAPEELSREQWLRLANTSARNEITSFFRSKYRRESPLAESSLETAALETHGQWNASNRSLRPEGNTGAETASLLCQIWKISREFSLRQKYSFLLQEEELVINLLSHSCCRRQEMAEAFGLDKADFDTIVINLPLSDEIIRDLIERKTGEVLTVRQIWMARGKAKAKLAAGLKPLL